MKTTTLSILFGCSGIKMSNMPVGFLHTQYSVTLLVSKNSTYSPYHLPRDSIRVHRLKFSPSSPNPLPLQTPVTSPVVTYASELLAVNQRFP